MKILILGSTGYLGKKVVEHFEGQGHDIICLINKLQEHTELSENKYSFKDMDRMFAEKKEIDWCINLVGKYQKNNTPDREIVEGNLWYPLNVFWKCMDHGIKKYINIGTALPQDFNLYAYSKHALEGFGRYYSEMLSDLQFVSLQLEYFYDKDEPKDRFISSVIQKLKNNQDVDLTDGMQRRDFIHISDVLGVMEYFVNSPGANIPYLELRVGTGEGPKIREVVEYLKEITNSKSNLNFGKIPKRRDEPDSFADLKELERLGIQLKYSWKKGMRTLFEE